MPSLAVELPSWSRRPSPSRRALHHPSIRHRTVHRRPSPLCSWSIAVALAPSLAVEESSRRPSPSRSRCVVHCRQGAACRLTTPATRHAPPMPLVRMVVVLPLLTPPPSICRRLSLRHRLSCLSSIRLVVTSHSVSRRHLPSAGASASHRAVASCHGIIKEQ